MITLLERENRKIGTKSNKESGKIKKQARKENYKKEKNLIRLFLIKQSMRRIFVLRINSIPGPKIRNYFL